MFNLNSAGAQDDAIMEEEEDEAELNRASPGGGKWGVADLSGSPRGLERAESGATVVKEGLRRRVPRYGISDALMEGMGHQVYGGLQADTESTRQAHPFPLIITQSPISSGTAPQSSWPNRFRSMSSSSSKALQMM